MIRIFSTYYFLAGLEAISLKAGPKSGISCVDSSARKVHFPLFFSQSLSTFCFIGLLSLFHSEHTFFTSSDACLSIDQWSSDYNNKRFRNITHGVYLMALNSLFLVFALCSLLSIVK